MTPSESKKEPKSYFIKKTLAEVVFPDQSVSNPSSSRMKEQGVLRLCVFIGAGLTLILGLSWGMFSFFGNSRLIDALREASLGTLNLKVKDVAFEQHVAQLDRLQVRLNELGRYEAEGVPFRLSGGLYRGGRLYRDGLDLYFRRFSEILLPPTQGSLEVALRGAVSATTEQGSSDDFSRLKTYLLLSNLAEPRYMDPLLEQQLQKIWHQLLPLHYGDAISKNLEETIRRQIAFYTSFLKNETERPHSFPFISPNPALIGQVRQVLSRIPLHERMYQQALGSVGATKWPPFTIDTVLQDQETTFLAEGEAVPGLFTLEGWRGEGGFTSALEQVLQGSNDEAWVLALEESTGAEIRARILELYFQEYSQHWLRFLSSLHFGDVEIAKVLEPLSKEDSVYVKILQAVDRNTQLEEKNPLPQGGAGVLQKITEKLKIETPDIFKDKPNAEIASASNPVTTLFQALHTFVLPTDKEKNPTLVQYLAELGKANEIVLQSSEAGGVQSNARLLEATRNVERLLLHFDPPIRAALAPFLLQPFRMASEGGVAETLAHLNRRWSGEVYQACRQGLGGRYPFQEVGEDAALADVASFFHPREGTLWRWIEREMDPFVENIQGRWEVKKGARLPLSAAFLDSLRYASAISERLFSGGSPEVKILFDVYPYPRTGVEKILIRIDDTSLPYRNEPQEWMPFHWPGDATGASLEVHVQGEVMSKQYSGPWGLFRLLGAGVTIPSSNTQSQIRWDMGQGVNIQMDLRSKSYRNPFQRGLFSNFKCLSLVG